MTPAPGREAAPAGTLSAAPAGMNKTLVSFVFGLLATTACSSSSSRSTSSNSQGRPDSVPPPAVEPGEQGEASIGVVRSAQQRNMDPQLAPADLETLTKSQANLAVDLYHAVRKRPENADQPLFLSPHSVSIALAMTYGGARGATASEMKRALHFELPDERLHTAFGYLDLALANRGKRPTGTDAQPFRLEVTSSVWGQAGTSFEAPFLDNLAVNYGAGLNVVDFVGATERSRSAINGWVEEKTERRIKNILPQGSVNQDTRLVLVNAVYFKAAWATKFAREATAEASFTKLDGSKVPVAMMSAPAEPRAYVKGTGYEAVELPYVGDELSMLVIAPTGPFADFEASLTGERVLDVLAGLARRDVQLSLPKLKLESTFALKAPLQSLGMKEAFEQSADFSGISAADKLRVDDVLHKTFLQVDEEGTEAAASTAVTVVTTSAPVDVITMKVDRPFLVAIVDRATKTLVFVGRVLEPKL